MSNAVTNIITLLQIFQGLSALPVLTPLRPACQTAVVILQQAQAVHQLKKNHAELAQRAAHLVLAVVAKFECSTSELTPELSSNINFLLDTLQLIERRTTSYASLSWWKRLWKFYELQDGLDDCKDKLADCQSRFIISSLIDIQRLQVLIREDLNVKQPSVSRSDYECWRSDQVNLERSLKELPSSYLALGKLQDNCGKDMRGVVVKTYIGLRGTEEFRREIKRWQGLRHPNLHQVLGHSELSSNSPFMVLSHYYYSNVHEHLGMKLCQGEVESFMATLHVMQGVASGLEYLRKHLPLSKRELEECANASNFVLTPKGQVIIGHNLITHEPESTKSQTSSDTTEWLREVFWYLTATFVFGVGSIDYSDWTWATARRNGRSASHLRYLPRFTCYLIPTFSEVVRELTELANKLDERYFQRKLMFRDIRQAVLGLESLAFIYRPREALDIEIGDVGFMEDGRFVVLSNIRDQLDIQYVTPTPLTLTCSGSYEVGGMDGLGLTRHTFNDVCCASIRRHSASQVISKYEVAWEFLLSNAFQICQQHLERHPNLCIQDLILVAGVQHDLRYSILNWTAKDSNSKPPAKVEFVEYANPTFGRPWGDWIIQEDTEITIRHDRVQQEIIYVQLEASDMFCSGHLS